MSTLTTHQMLHEALGPLQERFKYIKDQTAIDRAEGYLQSYDRSFEFTASDGHPLNVKVLQNPDPEAAINISALSGQQYFTIASKTGHLINHPCITTGTGDLIFVHDPDVLGSNTIARGLKKYGDPQQWWYGKAREIKNKTGEHIPRPMNAFIIYRNAQMAAVRRQHPGIGNNDVSRIIGKNWRTLDPEIRAHYKTLAWETSLEHQAKHPGYKYTPRRPEDVVRRRKRTVITKELVHNRNPRIHHNTDSSEPPSPSLHQLIPGFPDLDKLTNAWSKEPSAAHFEALMDGFDYALGLAATANNA